MIFWNAIGLRLFCLLLVVPTLRFWFPRTTAATFTTAVEAETGEGKTSRSNESPRRRQRNNRTNVVILLADNLAYDDVGIFQGAHNTHTHNHDETETTTTTTTGYSTSKSRTPNLDKAAMEGRRLLNWNSPAVLCSASRAALLTGE